MDTIKSLSKNFYDLIIDYLMHTKCVNLFNYTSYPIDKETRIVYVQEVLTHFM